MPHCNPNNCFFKEKQGRDNLHCATSTVVWNFIKPNVSLLRWGGKMGITPAAFHSVPSVPPCWNQCCFQTTGASFRPKAGVWRTHVWLWHWCFGAYSGSHHPSTNRIDLSFGRRAHVSHLAPEAAYSDWLSHARPSYRRPGAHQRRQSWSPYRSVSDCWKSVSACSNSLIDECLCSGAVLPVGGLLLGESFIEPLSGRMARVGGGSVRGGKVVPHAGGFQALLDCQALGACLRVVELLQGFSEEWSSATADPQDDLDRVSAATSELEQAWKSSQHCMLQMLSRLEAVQEQARSVAENGSSVGGLELFITKHLYISRSAH